MPRHTLATTLWLGVLYLVTAGITVVVLHSFILPEHRGQTFYTVLMGACVAELAFFAYLLHLLTAEGGTQTSGHPVRLRTMAMVAFWTVAILVSGGIALAPSLADTFYADKLLAFQLIFTFLVLAGAYLFHRQGAVLEDAQAAPRQERVTLQSFAAGIDPLLAITTAVVQRWPAGAVELDRLAKRLDTLRTQLLSVSPAAQRDGPRAVQPVTAEEIERHLRDVHAQVRDLAEAAPEALPGLVTRVSQAVEGAVSTLRLRGESLTF